jgi:hypothetical protein
VIGHWVKFGAPDRILVEALKCPKCLRLGLLSVCRPAEDFIEQFAQR